MTMRKLSYFAALVVAMTAVSCAQEIDAPVVEDAVTFTASFDAAASKAVLKPGADESKVEWESGDQVSVFAAGANYLFVAQTPGASTTLTTEATGVPTEGEFYAVYPYDADATLAEGVITTELPAEQTAVLGSFSTHLAVAQANGTTLAFKNVCGLVKVNVSAENVTKIVLEGNSGEVVAGAVNVTVADAPTWTAVAEQGATSVSLAAASGTLAKGDYYFAVLPQTFAAGFKVTAYKGETASVIRDVTTEVTIARADIVAGKSFGIDGEGTEASPYIIKTAQDMVDMRSLATYGGETWFKMANDIDMKGVTNYIPVNYSDDSGSGDDLTFERKIHFDGGNFTISNFSSDFTSYPSLFGVLYGSVKDLKVVNAVIEGGNSVCGIIGGYIGTTGKPATVTNVSVQGTVTSNATRAGGFCGNSVSATFVNCKSDVTVTSTSSDVAGFVGKAQQTVSFTDCEAKVNLSSSLASKNRVGGFVGWLNTTTASFENCKVLAGSVIEDKSGKTASAIGMYSGFVAYDGSTESTTIKNCFVDATLKTVNCQSVSGLVAIVGGGGALTITGCGVNGSLTGSNQIAGLIAYAENAGAITVTDSYSNAPVTGGEASGSHYCAGLLGNIGTATSTTLKNCYATGDVVSGGSSNASLVGAITKGTFLVEDCYSTGSVKGNNNVGGLVGNFGVAGTMRNSYYKSGKVTGSSIGGLIGSSQAALLSNCYAEAEIESTATDKVGGLIGSISKNITIEDCHFSGSVKSIAGNTGGLIGRATAGVATVSRCYTTGTVTANGNNVGGIFGYATGFILNDSWTSMDVTTKNQSIGGIVGTMGAPSTINNCFSMGTIIGNACVGGIVGQSYNNAAGSVVTNSISWGKIENNKPSATNYSGGAVIGCVHTKEITAKNCWRNPNMIFTDYSGVYEGEIMYNNPLVDHDDVVNGLPPYVQGIPSDATNAYAQRPYHGKAAAADATISSVAKSLGWDETVWDLSGATPVLK